MFSILDTALAVSTLLISIKIILKGKLYEKVLVVISWILFFLSDYHIGIKGFENLFPILYGLISLITSILVNVNFLRKKELFWALIGFIPILFFLIANLTVAFVMIQ